MIELDSHIWDSFLLVLSNLHALCSKLAVIRLWSDWSMFWKLEIMIEFETLNAWWTLLFSFWSSSYVRTHIRLHPSQLASSFSFSLSRSAALYPKGNTCSIQNKIQFDHFKALVCYCLCYMPPFNLFTIIIFKRQPYIYTGCSSVELLYGW